MTTLYHLGCGGNRLDGYVNIDLQPSPATDLVADLTIFEPPQPAYGILSNAFFEHLRRPERVPHLRSVRRALTSDGFACYLGLPDFRRIAELYLEGGPGVVGPTFDLFNVYRYTHGDPEQKADEAGWVAQLHKALFDVRELTTLLSDAGFPSYVVFRYVYPGEPPETDLSLGFYAAKDRHATDELETRCTAFLRPFDGRLLDLGTLRFADGASRSARAAALAGGRKRVLLRRVARVAANRLARI